MPGRSAKRKGYRVEREIVALHLDMGLEAERVPLSGAAGGSYTGDLVIAKSWRGEVKARKGGAGFKVIEGWLGDNDLLFLRRDRAEPLVVLPWATYQALMEAWAKEETRCKSVKAASAT